MLEGISLQTIFTVICGCVTVIYSIDKFLAFSTEKFNIRYNRQNESEHMKQMLSTNTNDINDLKRQNKLIIDGVSNLLRQRIKEDALEYITRGRITTEELEEYNNTYSIYKSMGGNGAGTRYHDEVLKLKIVTLKEDE